MAIELTTLTPTQKSAVLGALGLNETITRTAAENLSNKTLINPGQLDLPLQRALNDTSAVTRSALVAEASENFLTPICWRTPVTGGTGATVEANSSQSIISLAASTATQNSFGYVKSFNHPLANWGSGSSCKLSGSKFSLLFDIFSNGFPVDGTTNMYECRLLFGISATTDVASLVPAGSTTPTGSFSVVWNGINTGKLQFHNGSITTESQFTVPSSFQINSFHRWMVTWNGSTLSLYNKSWGTTESVADKRWNLLISITPTLAANTNCVGNDIVIGVVRTSNAALNTGFSPSFYINSAYMAPFAIVPNT